MSSRLHLFRLGVVAAMDKETIRNIIAGVSLKPISEPMLQAMLYGSSVDELAVTNSSDD